MRTQSIDTHPDIEKIQIELLRKATPAKRFSIMSDLTATAIGLSRRAIKRANPSFSDLEVNLAFVALHYGDELANKVRAYYQHKENESV